jgi:hypothetical protein
MSTTSQPLAPPGRIDNVYRIEAELGRGGMARVYRVVHEPSGARFALKQLTATDERSATVRAMFEHEYHTLVQLAHPNIVRVFEYGLDADNPYYTLELLEGTDAREATAAGQLGVRGICVLLRDCASALALVHARRLLHRDVSPRNLWCTPAGRGKLIDFGTLVAMGPQTRVAGTPPYVAPEALENQVLDARYDLFGLGALAYYMLTGHNAYPARTLGDLPTVWRSRPKRPDLHVADGLADLVMSMLSLDPRGRPLSAAEVYERVSAIAELPIESDRAAAQAYLTSPKLVGRGEAVARLRRRLQSVVQGRGSTVPIVGAAGLGKSRMVASALVEAKLGGVLAIRADAGSVAMGPLGVAKALVERLFEIAPLSAALAGDEAAVLAQISPQVRQALGQPELTQLAAHEHTRKLSGAILALLQRVTEQQSLLIAVDDVHRADNASRNVLGRLSLLTDAQRLLLVVSCDAPMHGASPLPGLSQLLQSRHRLELCALAPEHTRELLESLFGEAPGLDTAAGWLHEFSAGNPQTCMHYAQYLVDARIARYNGGRWQLPNHFDGHGMPPTLSAIFEQRIRALSPDARELALGLALARDDSRAVWQPDTHIRVEHFPLLLAAGDAARAHTALDELLRAGIVEQRDQQYVLAQRALADVLRTSSDEATCTVLHVRVASILDHEVYQTRWLPVRHLQLANEGAQATERVLAIAHDYAHGAADWAGMRVSLTVECTSRALQHLHARGGSARGAIAVRRVLLMAASVYNWSYSRVAGEAQLAQLRADCGLDEWSQTDASQPELQRVFACLKSADERHKALPEAERGLAPADALRELAGCVMVMYGSFVNSHDVAGAKIMPTMIAPLRGLSPVLALISDLAQLAVERVTGKEIGERTLELGVLQLLAASNVSETLRQGASAINAYIQAIEHARRGNRRGIDIVQRLVPTVGEEMFLVVHARWLANAFFGDDAAAERYRRQVELITDDDVWRRKSYLFAEAELHALTGDLAMLSDVCDAIAELADEFEGWWPWHAFAQGSLQRWRGNLQAASAAFERGLSLALPGEHRAFTRLGPAHAEALLLSGDARGALHEANEMLEAARQLTLDGFVTFAAERIRALARSAMGDHDAAYGALQAAEQAATDIGLGGLQLARLHEAAARVALTAGATERGQQELSKMAMLLQRSRAPAFISALAALQADHRLVPPMAAADPGQLQTSHAQQTALYTELHTQLSSFQEPAQRTQHALQLLMSDSGADAGELLLFGEDGIFSAAAVNQNTASPDLLARAEAYVFERVHEQLDTATASGRTATAVLAVDLGDGSTRFSPILLWDVADGESPVAGVALLATSTAPLRAPRSELVRIVSRCLLGAGDTRGLQVAAL